MVINMGCLFLGVIFYESGVYAIKRVSDGN